MCVRLYVQKLKHLSSTRSICESAIIVRSSFTNITTSFVYIWREEYDANNIKYQLILARIARWRPSALFSIQRRSFGEREIFISLRDILENIILSRSRKRTYAYTRATAPRSRMHTIETIKIIAQTKMSCSRNKSLQSRSSKRAGLTECHHRKRTKIALAY